MSTERSVNQWAEVKPLSRMREVAAIWMFIKRDFRVQTYFKFAFLMGLISTVPQLIIFWMIARFGQSVPEVRALSGGYVNFVISGLVLNSLLAAALTGPYKGLMDSFWNDRVEIIMVSPLRLPIFVTGLSLGNYVETVLKIIICLGGATLFLGFTWPQTPNVFAFLAVLIPALLACTGLGLAAASSVYTLDARGGQDPILLVVETISGLIAGVYFPLQVLPGWAQWIAHLVPHTYALDGMRRALFGSDKVPLLPIHSYLSLPPLAADCLVLTVYAVVVLPIGWKMFQYGIKLARTDGRLSRWT